MVMLFLIVVYMLGSAFRGGVIHGWDCLISGFFLFWFALIPAPFFRAAFFPWRFDEQKVEVGSFSGLGRRVFYEWSKIIKVKEKSNAWGGGEAYILIANDKKCAWVMLISYSKKDLERLSEILHNVQKNNPNAEISPSLWNSVAGV